MQRVLELRQDGGQAAVKKIAALLDRVGSDGRVRGSFIYHKASTGRWAGTGPQPQNLKRPEIDDVDAAITAVATGDYTMCAACIRGYCRYSGISAAVSSAPHPVTY